MELRIAYKKIFLIALVDQRGKGLAVHMPNVTGKNIRQVLVRNAYRARRLTTLRRNTPATEVSERAGLGRSLVDHSSVVGEC